MKLGTTAALAIALAGLAGCLGRDEPPVPEIPDAACLPGHFTFLATDTTIYRQGATVRVTPTVDIAPAGTRALPLHCTSGWTVTGAARLSEDRTTLVIDPDAPPGSEIVVRFLYAGEPVQGRFRVVGRDEVVLTGRRGQQRVEGCVGADPVRELEFSPGSRFSVTFTPFETYRDYWGSYSFDPATGALRMTVEGGNFVPAGLDLEGQAVLTGGRLILRGFYLGSRNAPPPPADSCTYSF